MTLAALRHLTLSTGEELVLRAATHQEAHAAHAFMLLQLEATGHLLTPGEVLTDTNEVKRWCAFYCDQPDNLLLLAWSGRRIVGALDFHRLSLVRQDHLGQLGISLAPAYRGLGLGRSLILCLFDWLEGHPAVLKVSVQILAGNTASIHLFQKCGFRLEARFSQAVQTGQGFEDLLLFSRWLHNGPLGPDGLQASHPLSD